MSRTRHAVVPCEGSCHANKKIAGAARQELRNDVGGHWSITVCILGGWHVKHTTARIRALAHKQKSRHSSYA